MTDDELERRLDEHLAATASPLPPHVADAVFREVAGQSQVGARWETWARVRRASLAVGAAAAVVLAAALGPGLLGRLGTGPGPGAGGSPGATPTYVWDAVLNYRGAPIQTNPSMDGYGNPAVWSYLRGPAGAHDPSAYVRLVDFDAGPRDAWVDPGSILAIGLPAGVDRLTLQPADRSTGGGDAAIVAWRSPFDVTIRVAGAVEVDGTCGDGVRFWMDRGREALESFDLPAGTRAFDRTLTVGVGQTLYLGVEPGAAGNADCDTTWLRLTITAP